MNLFDVFCIALIAFALGMLVDYAWHCRQVDTIQDDHDTQVDNLIDQLNFEQGVVRNAWLNSSRAERTNRRLRNKAADLELTNIALTKQLHQVELERDRARHQLAVNEQEHRNQAAGMVVDLREHGTSHHRHPATRGGAR